MKLVLTAVIAFVTAAFISCNNESNETTTSTDSSTINHDSAHNRGVDSNAVAPMAAHAEATISGTTADTTVTGSVKFDTTSTGVKMMLEITVEKKAGKEVAVHLHEHGDCGDKGQMAHGHWNPTNAQHGKWESGSFHLGDIGNVRLDSKGRGTLTINTKLWTLGGAPSTNILGKAVIVHGGVDDYTTQPTGNAGSRIGCGVIQ